jgi:two-component system, NtrC family, response regulator PilR
VETDPVVETDIAAPTLKVQRPPLDCLLVDDDPLIRLCLETIIREAGHQVTTAADGALAVEILGTHHFDVVISDIRMPKMDGWGVLAHVHESSPSTDVILMTAYATGPDSLLALKVGACDYLPKPVDARDLQLQLEELSERRAGRKSL